MPNTLREIMRDSGLDKTRRVMAAVLKMKMREVKGLREAGDGR
jgi:hypothetical protein